MPRRGATPKAVPKNGGVDTDQNLSDFSVVAPQTAPTAPIVEIGPSIVSTDPSRSGNNAPRDANITVNFSEPVDVNSGWFGIVCATSGVHDDATMASIFGGSWVIMPNVNFTAGETCTVTILKDFVHDIDLDDSAPNTERSSPTTRGPSPSPPAHLHPIRPACI